MRLRCPIRRDDVVGGSHHVVLCRQTVRHQVQLLEAIEGEVFLRVVMQMAYEVIPAPRVAVLKVNYSGMPWCSHDKLIVAPLTRAIHYLI